MQKRVMFIAILLLAICNKIVAANGIDEISISDFSVSAGASKEVGVMLTNEETYVGFQFDLYLPEGIAVDTFSVNNTRIPGGTTLQMAQQADGAYRFIAFSQDRQPITGNSGAVMTITVKASESVVPNSYSGYLRNVKISTTDGSGVIIAEQPFTVTVKGDEPYAMLTVDSVFSPAGGDVEYSLMLYYDNKRDSRGTTLDIADFSGDWYSIATSVKTVTFDSSFANYYPTSTASWFSGFSNMTTINGLENLRTDNVTNMNMMFMSCTSLESIDVSHFNTEQVADMSSLFAECSSLTELDLNSFKTSAVTNMEYMFYMCSSLQKILVSNSWGIGDLTSSQEMFGECSSLVGGMGTAYDANHVDAAYAYIDLASSRPGYFTPKGGYVTKPTISWSGDELSMTSEDGATIMYAIVKSDEASGSEIEYDVYVTPIPVLYDALISIYAVKDDKGQSETVTFNYPYTSWKALADAISAANDVLAAAQGNKNVTDEQRNDLAAMITAAQTSYNARTDSVASVNNMAGQLAVMSNSISELVNAVDEPYAALSDNNTVLTFYYDKKKKERNGMGVGPFSHYSQRPWQTSADAITTIVIDNSFAQCDTLTNIAWWFYELKNLTQINGMANLKTDHVTNMSHLFAVSWSLPSVDVSHFNTSNVTNMEAMFTSCWALTNLDVSNFNTEKVTNMAGMFNSLNGITTLDISNFNTANVTNMQGMFGSNQSLTTIFVGGGWSTVSVTGNGGSGMFSGSTSIMGGMGTAYDENHVDYTYANIDGGSSNPGYFTPKNGYGMAANPTFTHEGNLVFINSATEGATIRYTIDGEVPADSIGIVYSDSIRVTRNCTIRAIAVRENFTPSEVATYDVDWFKVADVQFAQNGNMVTLSTTTADATIFYTLSNNNGEQEYTAPLTMTGDCTIMAWATRDGYTPSDTTSFVFHAGGVTCSNPVFTPNENVITISTQTDGASIYYTTDGTDPTEQSTLYGEPITVDHNMTIKAIAMRQNYYSSQIVTFVVDTFKCVKPTFAWSDDELTITTTTTAGDGRGADILYTMVESSAAGTMTPQPHNGEGERVYATFEDPSNTNTTWNDSTRTFTWSTSYYNQLRNIGLPSGDITKYKKLVVDCEIKSGEQIRILFYKEGANLTLYAGNGVNQFILPDTLKALYPDTYNDYLLDCSEICLSGNNSIAPGEAVINSIYLDTSVTTLYTGPITVTNDVTISAIAHLDGYNDSEEARLVYPYTAWKELVMAIADAQEISAQAATSDNVTVDQRSQLDSLIAASNAAYRLRTDSLTTIKQRTDELMALTDDIRQLVNAIDEPYAVLTGDTISGMTLTFYYDKKKEVRNGMDIGPFTNSSEKGWSEQRKAITDVVFDESFANDTTLTSTSYWFSGLEKLTTITNIQYLNTAKVTDMNHMFMYCIALKQIDLANFNTANVVNMNSMFYSCTGLEQLNLTTFNTEKVTDMSNMFSFCEGLRSVDVSSFNTSAVTTMEAMFNQCVALETLDVRNFDTHNVKDMSWMFNQLKGVSNLDLTHFNTENVTNMSVMFSECNSMSVIDLSSFNTLKVENMNSMFHTNPLLKTIFVGDGWTTENVVDSEGMFVNCPNIVGGKGTTYNSDYNFTDKTYAHIDGGEDNPGYFTRSGDNPWVEPTEKLDPPVMSWNGDVLSWLVYQQYSTVMTWLSDTDVNDDSVVDDKDFAYYSQMTIQRDVTIRAFAKKEGMINSDTITIDYPYTAWQELLQARAYSMETISMCNGSPKVDQNEVEVLSALTTDADSCYRERKLSRNEIMQRANDLLNRSAMLRNQLEAADFALDAATGVMIVGEGTTLAQALEAAGGSSVAAGLTAIIYNHNVPLTNSELEAFSNPNLLIYVLADSLAPFGRNNVVVDGVAENIVLSDATGNDDFYCPQAFTAERISYTREFNQQTQVDVCRGWETIALPFSVQTITHERNGVIAPFGSTDSEKHFWLRQLTQSGLRSATLIEANTPYLISMPNNTDAYSADFNQGGRVTFTAENAAVPVTTQHVTALADSTILFVPTTMQVGRSSDVWALNVGQVRGANLEGSVFERDFREVRPFEAYTVHRSNTPAPRFVPINDINGGNLTGISDASLVNSEKVNNEKWYDMNGRQLQQKPTKGGVYILNGKKVVLR